MSAAAATRGVRVQARTAAAPPRTPKLAQAGSEPWEGGALILLALVTFSFGLLQMYGASSFMAQSEGLPSHAYAVRQLTGAIPGALLALVLARMDYRRWQAFAWPLLGGVAVLLLLVILPGTEAIAPRVNGARRWLRLGVTIQPSEFAKIALIVWTAALAVKKQDRLHSFSKGLLPFLLVWLGFVVLIFLQPNLSAALLLVLLSALVLFAGGARIGHFILIGLVAVPVIWRQIQGASYRWNRIVAFLDSTADPAGLSYQIRQALIAMGSGRIHGVGFGQSQQKFGFLPEPHNDFLFAMIGEEWGWLGVLFVVGLFAGFGWVGFRIADRAADQFGCLLAVGMTNLLVVSALLHMGVSLALLPTTGVSLPFMSYGRSALLVSFVALGVLLSVARARRPGAS